MLSIQGTITTENSRMGLRTVEKKDITNPDGTPGLVSLARMNDEDMKYDLPSLYEAGKTSKTHDETILSYGLWKNRLEGPKYEVTVLYVLEDIFEPAHPRFMGYVMIHHKSKDELKLFSHIVKPYQRKGVMTILGQYLLHEFFPTLLAHPLTHEKASSYKTLHYQLFYRLPPNIDEINRAVERFATRVQIPISHSTPLRWSLDLIHLPKKERAHSAAPQRGNLTQQKPTPHPVALGPITRARHNLHSQSSRLSIEGNVSQEKKPPMKRLQQQRRKSAFF
ncbi:MAG: hypothetical protein JSS34_01205 [Proteobacteria bacterium]|nr:hypothetical protein [Pseudomonadota bacterium]